MRHLFTLYISLACAVSACIVGAIIPTTLEATVLPANGTEEDSPALGDGYDSVFKTKKWGCVSGKVEEDVNQSISSELQFASNMSLDSIVNSLEVGPQLSLNKYFFNLRANAQLMSAHSASETSTTFHFFWRGTGKTKSLNHGASMPLTPAIDVMQNIKHFDDEEYSQEDNLVHVRAACGDEFVSEIRYGAYLIVTLKINFATVDDKKRFDSEIQGGIPAAGSAQASGAGSSKAHKLQPDTAVGLSSNIGGKLMDLNRSHSLRSSSVEVIINQVGGDPTAIGKILGSNAINGKLITECTGNNELDKCVVGFSEAVAYAQDFLESLASSNQNLWSPMVYLTTPYTSVLSLASTDLFLLSEDRVISGDLEQSIEQLDLFLEQARAIEIRASNLLKAIDNDFYTVDQNVRKGIEEIMIQAQKVHIDIKSGIYHTCMKKSSHCAEKIEQFQNKYPYPYQLDIDERYLSLTPTVGGLEHLDDIAGSADGGKYFDHADSIHEPSERSIVKISLSGSQRPHELRVTLDDETQLTVGTETAPKREFYVNPFDLTADPIPVGRPENIAKNSLSLDGGERISYVEAHSGDVQGKNRVVFLKVCKSNSRFEPKQSCIQSGQVSNDHGQIKSRLFQQNERLIGFHGHQGKEIDQLGFIIAKKPSLVPSL